MVSSRSWWGIVTLGIVSHTLNENKFKKSIERNRCFSYLNFRPNMPYTLEKDCGRSVDFHQKNKKSKGTCFSTIALKFNNVEGALISIKKEEIIRDDVSATVSLNLTMILCVCLLVCHKIYNCNNFKTAQSILTKFCEYNMVIPKICLKTKFLSLPLRGRGRGTMAHNAL